MKNGRGLRHQSSDKAPVSFYDVVDSFSEEEWKLLQLWQKELYNNLMKELQQAFNSLGPLIATSVFSLKPTVKEDAFSVKLQDLDTMNNVNLYSGDTAAESEMMFEENKYLKGSPNEGEHGSNDVPNTGTADMAAAVSFSIKNEEEMYSDSEKSESVSCTTLTGLEATSPIASIGMNEVGKIYPIDMQDDPRGESSNSHLGKGNMNRKRVISNPFSYTDKPRLCKTSSKKLKANVVRRANQKDMVSPVWPGNDGELKEEIKTQPQSGFHQQADFSLQKIASFVEPSEICDNHESTMRIDNVIPCEKSTLQSTESGQSYQKDSFTGNQQARESKVRYPTVRYPCAECGKTLLGMSSLIMHQRIHTGERPFLCTICGKRFRQKGDVHRHQQVHTGARPHQCKLCPKTFTQKCHLQTHERTHIIAKIL